MPWAAGGSVPAVLSRLPGPGIGQLTVGARDRTQARTPGPCLTFLLPGPSLRPAPSLSGLGLLICNLRAAAPGLTCHPMLARSGVLDTQGPPARTLQVSRFSRAEGSQNLISAASAVLGYMGEATSPLRRFSSQLPRVSGRDRGMEGAARPPFE